MAKNNYAMKLAIKKQVEKTEWMKYAIQKTLDFVTIALNEDYHFGGKRLSRVSDRVNSLWEEYAELAEDGYEYADEKIKQRIDKIMKGKVGRTWSDDDAK